MSKQYTREEIKHSLLRGVSREMGICETIRGVYDSVHELPDGELKKQMTEKLIDALWMAKKIADRLAFYYEKYHDKTGSWGTHLVQQDKTYRRLLAKKRKERV